MKQTPTLPHPGIFHGWFVVAAAFAVTFVGFGSAYTFSAFVESLQQRFRRLARLGLAGVLAGRLSLFRPRHRQRPARRPLGLAPPRGHRHDPDRGWAWRAASAARSLVEVYAAYGLGVGLGVGCAYVPAVGAVQRWFVRRRGFASGLAVSGIGVGTLVMPPLASLLIDDLGWRDAYLVLGCLAAVIGGGHGAADRERSARPRPWLPTAIRRDRAPRRCSRRGASVREAIRSRRFIASLCRLPDLLIRRVRAVRPPRSLCARSRHRASPPPCCCSA